MISRRKQWFARSIAMLRTLLLQPSRDRYRRQDIYDIAYLLDEN
jgi:hypothetical protein